MSTWANASSPYGKRREDLIREGFRPECRADITAVETVVVPDPIAQSAKDLIMLQMLKGGVSFALRDSNAAAKPRPKRRRTQPSGNASSSSEESNGDDDDDEEEGFMHNSIEWQKFLRLFVEGLIDYGSVTVQRVYRPADRALFPGVLHNSQHDRWFRRLPERDLEMVAVWINLSEVEQRLGGVKNGDVIRNARVFTLYEPTPSGRLQSPSIRALPLVHHRLRYWSDWAYSSYWMSHPVWAMQRDPRVNAVDPAEVTGPSIDDLGKQAEQKQHHAHMTHVRIVRTMVNQGHSLNAERLAAIRAQPTYAADVESAARITESMVNSDNPAAFVPPYTTAIPLDPGESVASAPVPQSHSQMMDAILMKNKEIWAAYNAPAQLSSFEKVSQLASSNQLGLTELNERVQQLQRAIEPLLGAAYEWVYAAAMDSLEAKFVDKMREVTVQHSKAAAAAAAAGGNPSLRNDGVFDAGMESAARLVFRGSHKIEARLHYSLVGEYDSVQKAYVDGVIDIQRFRKHAAPLLGIPTKDISQEHLPHARTHLRNPGTAMLPEQIKALTMKAAAKPKK